jgi:hypothetical protein
MEDIMTEQTMYQDALMERARRVDAAKDRLVTILMRLTGVPNGSRVALLFPSWPEAKRNITFLTQRGFDYDEKKAILFQRTALSNLTIQVIQADDHYKWTSMFFESAAAIGEFDSHILSLLASKVRPMSRLVGKMYLLPTGVTASYEIVTESTPLP